MISGIDLTEVVDYTCKKDTDNPTVWKLGVLPTAVLGAISKEMTKPDADQVKSIMEVARFGLKGWTNYSIKGVNIEFVQEDAEISGVKTKCVPLSLINTIPLDVVAELGNEIFAINKLSGAEQKN